MRKHILCNFKKEKIEKKYSDTHQLNEIKANLTLYLTPNQTRAMQGGHNAAGQSNPTGTIISGQGDPQGKKIYFRSDLT